MCQTRDDAFTGHGRGRWVLTKLLQSANNGQPLFKAAKGEPEEKGVMTFDNEIIKQYKFLTMKGDTKG